MSADPLVIRPARSTDAGAVGGILSGFVEETEWMPQLHSRAEDIGFAGQMIDREWVNVAERAGSVVGFAACDGAILHALYVDRSARRQGVGAALLRPLLARSDALWLWTFEANAGAQAFYAAHGFAAAERTDGANNDEGLPDIRFVWTKETA